MAFSTGSRLKYEMSEIAELLISKPWGNIESNKINSLVKNTADSVKFRKQGNQLFTSRIHNAKTHEKALILYSKSIATAPVGSKELALAHGNRSALLFHLAKYQACIQDIERAMKIPLHSPIQARLVMRKIDCYVQLKKLIPPGTLEDIKNLFKAITLNDDIRLNYEEKLKSLKVGKCSENFECEDEDIIIGVRSKEIPCATKGLFIQHNEKYGRHIVAGRKIRPGEILAVEKPYFTFPNFLYIHLNCSHCLKFVWANIPCNTCAYAVYCSEKCKNEAWHLYHDIECSLMAHLWGIEDWKRGKLKLPSIRLAVIAVRKAGSIRKLREDLTEVMNCKDPRTRGFVDGIYSSNEYRSLFSLTERMDSLSRIEMKLMLISAASSLCALTKYTNFLPVLHCNTDNLVTDDALFIGALINRNQYIMDIYGHGFQDWKKANQWKLNDWERTIDGCFDSKCYGSQGSAVMPFCGLINHSCDANVMRIYREDQRVMILALRPIEKGEQLFDTYGPVYYEDVKLERQMSLKHRYKFICECTPCLEDWPLRDQLKWADLPVRKLMEEIDHWKVKCAYVIQATRDGTIESKQRAIRELGSFIEYITKNIQQPSAEMCSTVLPLTSILNSMYASTVDFLEECPSQDKLDDNIFFIYNE